MIRMRKTTAITRKFASSEKGSVIILTALMLLVVIGFIGLAIDVGRLYITKNKLQNAADMAATAAVRQVNYEELQEGAEEIKINKVQANAIARRFVKMNLERKSVQTNTINIDTKVVNDTDNEYGAKYVEVTVSVKSSRLPFMQVVTGQFGGVEISAHSVADLSEAHY